ncbi:hypothetical protein [Thermovirga lienii]|jgi:uncharacterized membrane protein HdeD (DUF308 family)|uniref:hypothetical protein n=1 Tax=Thermovirga lienii TaxID=336261 RepID=UPI002FE2C5E1
MTVKNGNKKLKIRDVQVPLSLSLPFHLISWSLLALGVFLLMVHVAVVTGAVPSNDMYWITTVRKDFSLLDPVTAIRWKLYIPQYVKYGRNVFIVMIGVALCMLGIQRITLKLFLRKYQNR